MSAVTHYARDDDLQPLCGGGRAGDEMTFFIEQTTCPECIGARCSHAVTSAAWVEDGQWLRRCQSGCGTVLRGAVL